ncbi:glycosyltransferase family 2 protein [Tautonia sociabilis]|uniref:Glycosyltransferase n=1 Tax=Tautonia sociabilis TaxID=2080755 RepID=A0A432MFG4_9BACT|nr:glycosyltransferase family 2 protein [Tautonia sociabilis]RUL84945.1 glycosyltransferase [Tautonia sociabilis]
MANRLSVCLLTRNDERNLDRPIRSVEGVADEVIVADTGSTDRTAEVARDLGARVVQVAWDDDFAEGRNAAIAEASGDWILWINPDEALEPGAGPMARALVAGAGDAFGFLARIRHQARADRPEQYAESWDLRLFRKGAGLRYVGRLHPSLATGQGGEAPGDPPRVVPSELAIRRWAFLSTLDPGKLRWAARLLRRELADRPGRLHFLIEYGRTLLRLEDPEGHSVMAEAVARVADEADAPGPPSPDAQLALEYVLTAPADRYRGLLSKAEAAALALRWFPNSPGLLWALAGSYFHARQFAAAAVLLDRLLRLGASGEFDRSQPFDPGIVGPRAALNLSQCLRATGRAAEARRLVLGLVGDPDVGASASAILAELDASGQGGPALLGRGRRGRPPAGASCPRSLDHE